MACAKEETQAMAFEEALRRLEEAVRHLEAGDLTLEASLAAFEEGIRWSRVCEARLTEARGKVEQLVKRASGEMATESFATEQ